MWILFKLFAAAFVFVYRIARGHSADLPEKLVHSAAGIPYGVEKPTYKGQVTKTTITFRLKSAVVFKFSAEHWYDRFAKALGIASEIQTGAKEFDRKIYITSDSWSLGEHLKRRHDICNEIAALFAAKPQLESIFCDGEALDFIFKGDQIITGGTPEDCAKIAAPLLQLGLEKQRPHDKRFLIRALVIETLIWSIVTYAACGVLEIFAWKTDTIKDWTDLLGHGFIFGVLLFILPLALAVVLMRGSSRGHRIVAEAFFLLLFSSMAAGYEAACDLNQVLDKSAPINVELLVLSKYTTVSGGGRYRQTHHWVTFAPRAPVEGIDVPLKIEVSYFLYSDARVNGVALIKMRRGAFGAPWYQDIAFSEGGTGGF